jgi:hypothetical protein
LRWWRSLASWRSAGPHRDRKLKVRVNHSAALFIQ